MFQSLMNPFSNACTDFGLTISPKKVKVLAQATILQNITFKNYQLEMVDQFTYLGSTASSKLSLNIEIDRKIARAATTLACLGTHVWKNPQLTIKTKESVYKA